MKKILISILICLVITSYFIYDYFKYYYNEHFNIETIYSDNDYDNDSIDDYHDILEGAKIDAKNRPKYKSAYYANGYPPSDEGVCTDLIWRAFKNAGYDLKTLIDEDIKNNQELYNIDIIDPNIDFRRVGNLKIFFERNATNLTLDINDISSWQAGDIVVFGTSHIGIISDKRNKEGIPFLIHNAGQFFREENALVKWHKKDNITGHYRWEG